MNDAYTLGRACLLLSLLGTASCKSEPPKPKVPALTSFNGVRVINTDAQGAPTEVHLVDAEFTQGLLDALKAHPTIESLLLKRVEGFNQGAAFALGQFPKLSRLHFEYTPVDASVAVVLSQAETLKSLSLDRSGGGEDVLKIIGAFPNLEELRLRAQGQPAKSRPNDDSIQRLAQLKNLRVLEISGTAVAGPGLRLMKSINKLEALFLDDNLLTTHQILTHLPTLKNLKRLHLGGNLVDNGIVEAVDRLPALEHLVLGTGFLDKKGMVALQTRKPGLRVHQTAFPRQPEHVSPADRGRVGVEIYNATWNIDVRDVGAVVVAASTAISQCHRAAPPSRMEGQVVYVDLGLASADERYASTWKSAFKKPKLNRCLEKLMVKLTEGKIAGPGGFVARIWHLR